MDPTRLPVSSSTVELAGTKSTPSPTPLRASSAASSAPQSPSSTTSQVVDSGVTHTIPNDSTVTVIKHTTITRSLPPTTTDVATSLATEMVDSSATISATFSTWNPTATASGHEAGTGQRNGGISTGAVAGIAVGGVFVATMIAVLLYLWRSRRQRRVSESDKGNEAIFLDKTDMHDNILGRRPDSAMLPIHPTPHQASTSSRGYGYDPFAPFGGKKPGGACRYPILTIVTGRADQPVSTTSPPPENTFEMDGRGIEVAELPGTAMTTPDAAAQPVQRHETQSVGAVKQRPSSDPRATLNHLPRENGRPMYINQWNQYKTLAGEADAK